MITRQCWQVCTELNKQTQVFLNREVEKMYVDHAFSISDEDIMMDGPYTVSNKAPIKEISLAVSLLVFGTLAIIIGSLMAYNHVGGDTAHGNNIDPFYFRITVTIYNNCSIMYRSVLCNTGNTCQHCRVIKV